MKLPGNKKLRVLLFLASVITLVIGLRLKQSVLTNTVEANSALQALPATMLWAWERPERLDFIDTSKVGVAFLAKTVYLRAAGVSSRPRLQPLVLAKGTKVVAVVRIESDPRNIAVLTEAQLDRVTHEIVETSQLPDILALQIDFDARTSERDFYNRLILKLRRQLPPAMPLSITALASWCAGDNWLAGLPIDEAVTMLFRMGADGRHLSSRLNAGEDPFAKPCDTAAGVSTDESIAPPIRDRLYIFSPTPWTYDSVTSTLETYSK